MPKPEKRSQLLRSFMKLPSYILLVLVLAACQRSVDKGLIEMLGTDNINQSVTLANIEPLVPVLVVEGEYEMLLRNHSAQAFVMPDGLAVKLLVGSPVAGEWIEVENRVTYMPENRLMKLAPPENSPEDELSFTVWPTLIDPGEFETLRVIVTGVNSDGEIAAAYVDIPLGE